jgi:quinol monooxygenase YgiN
MFARILTFEVKLEEREKFVNLMKDQVLPMLKKQVGFLEFLPFFEKKAKKERVLAISLWTTRRDAERYERDAYPRVLELLKPFLVSPVEVTLSNLETAICDRFVDALAV